MDTFELQAVKDVTTLPLASRLDSPYVQALLEAGWSIRRAPTPNPTQAQTPDAPWARHRAEDAEDGW